MRKGIMLALLMFFFAVLGFGYSGISVEAKVSSEQKKEYVTALSQAIRDGVTSKNMDIYAKVSKGSVGRKCLRQAILRNRAALMAEGIDFLDDNWKQYYAVSTVGKKTVFNSTKTISRQEYLIRYHNIMDGLSEVLACVEPSMTEADKAMAVYYYLTKNTVYQKTEDCHTGYDVLVNHCGVCDGFANAYALALNTLGIDCVVVSNYTRDHSWNMVKLGGQWYLCDLTNGIGSGNHEGMVVSYSSCLVGVSTFLQSHPGYELSDIYGQGNSNELNIRTLSIASTDYIGNNTAIRVGIAARTCMFYYNGYWYWISTGNMLKKSRLDGSGMVTVYDPPDDLYIGWIEKFNGRIYISLNDGIYRMNLDGTNLVKVRTVAATEYQQAVSSYFWQIAYVGRFYRNARGAMNYYIIDLQSAKKGAGEVYLDRITDGNDVPSLFAHNITLQAGYSKLLYVINAPDYYLRNLNWKSSNPKVAKVDNNGCVTALKKGTTIISAIVGNVQVKCKVKVTGYTITYKKAGINSPDNVASASGKKKIILRKPKKPGYTFLGWYKDKACRRRVKTIRKGNSQNYILYAKWKKK